MILAGLKPERVFYYFEELTKIPRESGNEARISDYLAKLGHDMGHGVIQESSGNVIIKKSASPGYEVHEGVILQGHMDMVCVKEDHSTFDFAKDAIELIVDGDYIRTNGTTLGADNGIAVAMALAILEDKTLLHPKLTTLFTVSEETGMDGAIALNPEHLEGSVLINLDSEEEGVLLASNAGGANVDVILPIQWVSHEYTHAYSVSIKGLKGGHSGIEIDKNRANGIKLIGRLLELLDIEHFDIHGLEGGEKMNAIAKHATVRLATYLEVPQFLEALEKIELIFKTEYQLSDPDVHIEFSSIDLPEFVWSQETMHAALMCLRLIPQGVQTMSQGIPGLVESSNNVGVMTSSTSQLKIINAVRSSVGSLKEEIVNRIASIASLVDGGHKRYADYPEWPYRVDSFIRELMIQTYQDLYSQTMKVQAIHAGLECGLLSEKLGNIDMISLGPEMHDVHTPKEHLSISSTERVYHFLIEVLLRLKH
jgi:dipeptidase D